MVNNYLDLYFLVKFLKIIQLKFYLNIIVKPIGIRTTTPVKK